MEARLSIFLSTAALIIVCITGILLYDFIFFERTFSVPRILKNSFKSNRIAGNEKTVLNVTFRVTQNHSILWYNKPPWIKNIRAVNTYLETKCQHTNCNLTTDKTSLKKHSAIIFSLQDGLQDHSANHPPIDEKTRNPNQVWIFFSLECPNLLRQINWYRNPSWRNTMNWSMSFRLDSDVVDTYGRITEKPERPNRNYVQLFRQKTKMVLWVVSNCKTGGRRDEFVKLLQKHGIAVDIFGRCGGGRISQEKSTNLMNKQYKFYLGFENNFCKDYVTEKFFKYFQNDIIIVVRGGADYNRRFPNGTFINTADFPTVSSLADYMKKVGSNETLYTDYLKRKDRFVSHTLIEEDVKSYCSMCRKLNNLESNRRTYPDISKYVFNDTCWEPTDLL